MQAEIARREQLLDYVQLWAEAGTWECDLASGQLRLSQGLRRILGLDSDRREASIELMLDRTHPDDRAHLERVLERARAGVLKPFEVRIARPDAELRYIRVAAKQQQDDQGHDPTVVGVARDVTGERLAARRIRLRLAVSRALASWTTLEDSGPNLLGMIACGLGCAMATLWLPVGDVMVPRLNWATPELARSEFASVTRTLRVPKGIELAGWAWSLRRPVDRTSLAADDSYVRHEVAARAGLSTAVAIPVMSGEQVVAVIDLHSQDKVKITQQSLQALLGLGYEIGSVIATRRGQAVRSQLTQRQLEVLKLAADGLTTPEIASRLVVEPATVKTHLDHIYAKFGVANRTAAVAYALRHGVID